MIGRVKRYPKTFSFNFDWPKDLDENQEYQFKFIIKSDESLAKNKTKTKQNDYC